MGRPAPRVRGRDVDPRADRAASPWSSRVGANGERTGRVPTCQAPAPPGTPDPPRPGTAHVSPSAARSHRGKLLDTCPPSRAPRRRAARPVACRTCRPRSRPRRRQGTGPHRRSRSFHIRWCQPAASRQAARPAGRNALPDRRPCATRAPAPPRRTHHADLPPNPIHPVPTPSGTLAGKPRPSVPGGTMGQWPGVTAPKTGSAAIPTRCSGRAGAADRRRCAAGRHSPSAAGGAAGAARATPCPPCRSNCHRPHAPCRPLVKTVPASAPPIRPGAPGTGPVAPSITCRSPSVAREARAASVKPATDRPTAVTDPVPPAVPDSGIPRSGTTTPGDQCATANRPGTDREGHQPQRRARVPVRRPRGCAAPGRQGRRPFREAAPGSRPGPTSAVIARRTRLRQGVSNMPAAVTPPTAPWYPPSPSVPEFSPPPAASGLAARSAPPHPPCGPVLKPHGRPVHKSCATLAGNPGSGAPGGTIGQWPRVTASKTDSAGIPSRCSRAGRTSPSAAGGTAGAGAARAAPCPPCRSGGLRPRRNGQPPGHGPCGVSAAAAGKGAGSPAPGDARHPGGSGGHPVRRPLAAARPADSRPRQRPRASTRSAHAVARLQSACGHARIFPRLIERAGAAHPFVRPEVVVLHVRADQGSLDRGRAPPPAGLPGRGPASGATPAPNARPGGRRMRQDPGIEHAPPDRVTCWRRLHRHAP